MTLLASSERQKVMRKAIRKVFRFAAAFDFGRAYRYGLYRLTIVTNSSNKKDKKWIFKL